MYFLLRSISCVCLLHFFAGLSGQEPVAVTKNFAFADGVYLSFAEFQENRPSYRWTDLKSSLFTNPQTFLTQIEFLKLKEEGNRPVPLDSVWGLCLGGIPYVRLPQGAVDKELPTFAVLQVRGKICYFVFSRPELRRIPMSAYNPLTGRPFRSGLVDRWEEVEHPMMLHFQTGEVARLTVDNFLQWIDDDERLQETVRELEAGEAQEKLFKCLLIYDDRNPVFVPASDNQ